MFGGTFDPPHVGHALALNAASEQLGLDCIYVVVANDPWQKSSGVSTLGEGITPAEHRLAMCQLTFSANGAGHNKADPAGTVQANTVQASAAQTSGASICVSACEIERGGASYTIDTVTELLATTSAAATQSGLVQTKSAQSGLVQTELAQAGRANLVLIVGEDVVVGLDSWHRASSLRELVTVAVVQRNHELVRPQPTTGSQPAAEGSPTTGDPATPEVPAGWKTVTVTLDLSATIGSQIVADVSSTDIRQQIADACLPTGIVAPEAMGYISAHGLYSQTSYSQTQ